MKTSDQLERARELVGNMWLHTFSRQLPRDGFETAKVCAIVCVDELIKEARNGYDYDAEYEIPFYEEVKNEIKSL